MNVSELREMVQAYVVDADGPERLILPAENDLGSQGLTDLLQQFLPKRQLMMTNVEPVPSEHSVVLKGTVDLFNQERLSAEAVFYLADGPTAGTPHLTLTVHLPQEGWTFSRSFPALEDTVIDSVRLRNPAFILESHAQAQTGQGLNFSGELRLDSRPLQPVAWLLKGSDPLALSGTIEKMPSPDQAPVMTLTTPREASALSLGAVECSLGVRLQSSYDRALGDVTGNPRLTTTVDFCSTVQIGNGQGGVEIPLTMSLPDGPGGLLSLRADVNDVPLAGLSDLSALVDGVDLGSLIPQEFSLGQHLSINRFTVVIAPALNEVASLQIGVQLKEVSWPIIPSLVSVDSISLDFFVQNPVQPKSGSISAIISATFVMAQAFDVMCSIALPDKTIEGYLETGDTIPVVKVVEQFLGEIPFPDDSLTIYKLSFVVDPSDKTYALSASIASDWTIDLGVTELALQSMNLDMSSGALEVDPRDFAIRDRQAYASAPPQKDKTGGTTTCILSGTFNIAGSDILVVAEIRDTFVLRGTISRINLTAILEKFLPGDVSLPDEVPDFELSDVEISITPSTGEFSLSGTGTAQSQGQSAIHGSGTTNWEGMNVGVGFSLERKGTGKGARKIDCTITLTGTGSVAVADELTIDKVDLVFSLSKGTRAAAWAASGTVSVKAFDTALDLQAAYRKAKGGQSLTLSSDLKRPLKVVSIGSKGALTLSAFSMELTKGAAGSSWRVSGDGQVAIAGAAKFAGNLTLSKKDDGTTGLVFAASRAWRFQIGPDGISVRKAVVNIQRSGRKRKKTVSGSIVGVVQIGSATMTVAYDFPGDLVIQGEVGTLRLRPLINALCETGLLGQVPMPANIRDLEFSNVVFSIAPQARTFSLTGDTDLGRATLIVKKAKNRWGFGIGIVPPEDWKLSGLDNRLRSLDGLTFSKSALVLSSTDAPAFEIRRGRRSTSTVSVTKGLNFVAELSMAGLGVEELMKKRVRPLRVLAAIGSNPRKMILEVGIPGQVTLARNFTFGDVRFRLRPSSPIPSIALVGVVTATLDKSPLRFIGAFTVEPRSASIQATMDGSWENPFGTRGVVISDVALKLGVSFPPFKPSEVGITGALKVGDVTGSAAVNFDTKVPSHSMLAAEFTRLSPMDVLPKFLGPAAESRIPKGMTDILSEVTLRDVKIYIVPQPTWIGELHYEQGLTVQGAIGVIRIGRFFELKGAGENKRATLALVVKTSGPPRLEINGAVALLGIKREVAIAVSDKGFKFEMSGTIFGAFDCTVEAEGSSLKEGSDFTLKVTMKNDLFSMLKREAGKAIKKASAEATKEIEAAQTEIDTAKETVNGIDRNIGDTRRTIDGERQRDIDRLKNARAEISKAQGKVNDINSYIKGKESRIHTLEMDIDKEWKRGTRGLKFEWYKKKKQSEITGLRGLIAGKRGVSKAANAALSLAKKPLKGLEIAADFVPIDLDPRMVVLFAAKGTANGLLDAANLALTGVKRSVGAVAKVGQYIADKGLGGLVDVRRASFESSLNAARGGRVALQLNLRFMGKPKKLAFDFNFHDPVKSAGHLAKQLLAS